MLLEINKKNIITSNYNLNATDTVVPFKHSFPNNYTTEPKISGYIFMLRTRLLCDYLTQFYVFPGSCIGTQYFFNKYMPLIRSTKPPALPHTKIQNVIGIS